MDEKLLFALMTRIADALEKLASGGKPSAPNIVRPLEEYSTFDWAAHNFDVVQRDNDGPTHVSFGGNLYTRRSPSNKFEPAIWYSAPAGKDAEGNVEYIRLITFRTFGEADPLPAKVNGATKHTTTQGKPASASVPPPAEKKAATSPEPPPAPNGERPYTSAVLWTKLVAVAAQNSTKPAAADMRSKMLAALRACFEGDPYAAKKAEDLLYSIAKVRDINLVKAGMVIALLLWLDPHTDAGGAISVTETVIREAKAMLEKKP